MREDNQQKVSYSSRKFFENGMRSHNAVKNIENLGDNLYLIERLHNKTDLKILVADIYIVGEADIMEINPTLLGIDSIVLIGFYNRYSFAAKEYAKTLGVGIFDNREFFGAINYTDKAFIDYKLKEK